MDQLANFVIHDMKSNNWMTPNSVDVKGGNRNDKTNGQTQLCHQAKDFLPTLPAPMTSTPGGESSKSLRRLNPRFVEWLMGLPTGWTDCDFVATESSPIAPKKHSEPSMQN